MKSFDPNAVLKLTHPLVYPARASSKLSMDMTPIANTAVLCLSYGLKREWVSRRFHTDVTESEVIGVRLCPAQLIVGEDFHGNHLDGTVYRPVSPEGPRALTGPSDIQGDACGGIGQRRHPVTHEVFISQVNTLGHLSDGIVNTRCYCRYNNLIEHFSDSFLYMNPVIVTGN